MTNRRLYFDESYGYLTRSLYAAIKRYNVSVSDWDAMLTRWGFQWGDKTLPFEQIDEHIVTHSQRGFYSYPMYY